MLRKTCLLVACAAGGGLTFAACGGDDEGNPDARRFDANLNPDGSIDAAMAVVAGTFSVLDAELIVRNGSNQPVPFASGPSIRMNFVDPTELGAPVVDTTNGTVFGCKVFEYTPAQFAASLGHDFGAMQVTTGDGSPVFPPCIFVPNAGYVCPDTATASTAGVIGPGPATGVFTLTDLDVTYSAAVLGRYVQISGATTASNNGAFPIVGFNGAAPNTIAYANPFAVAETLPATGASVTVGGAGPIPQVAEGTFIEDDESYSLTFTSSDQTLASFTGTVGDAANHFNLDAASRALLTQPPPTGEAFTLRCDDGGACGGDGIASVLNIQTTDAPVNPASPFSMPPPVTKAVLIRCTSAIGGTEVTIPADVSDRLRLSGATRIQSTFARAQLITLTPANNSLTYIAGTSEVGFDDIEEL
jgi:hypothetical protein